MLRKTALIKISGDLVHNQEVVEKIREISEEYFTAVLIGGGTQISEAFQAKGFPIKFGPLGRETETLEERQLSRDVLENNQAEIQDFLSEKKISVTVIVPIREIASVLCPVNGDIFVLEAYIGYDKLFVFTLKEREEKKKSEFEKYPKIEVIGF
ncbi:MAG: hypothetical protein ACD_8C00134G0011 [uncultured bacterium]|nr:MAG: hypothetical protein ACD_8C00134G0011 [uncultured bacterium]